MRPWLQDPNPFGLVQKHRIEDHLRQLREFIILDGFLSHGQLNARIEGLKVSWERRWGKGNPTSVPCKVRYGTRPDRTAGNGFWKATKSNDVVRDSKKKSIIGYERPLSFFHGQQSEKNLNNKICWVMHEYQLRVPKKETEQCGRKGKRAPTSINASTPGGVQSHKMIKSRARKEQQEEQQEAEPITVDVPINTNSIVTPLPTLNRTHWLITNALVDAHIHENSQTGMIFRLSPISMHIDPRINILHGHCSADQEQGAKGLDSYNALAINIGLHTSNLDEISAIFRNKRQWNLFLDDLRVGHWPLNDLPSSLNSFSVTTFDEISAIFQDQVKRSRRS
ncbi:hypothetical protein Cgig2_010302 [Carnegiea gigantea]|uniref:NAC domain-containing protein n=1 Tax=Carnegiea gigantea TaxID=171969 RepID=A0A9Q1KJ85_9CARY|nr:hypothetical protein Cgig2_010302 [Carnegiea gigantea]